MSDNWQVVHWALECECPMRHGAGWEQPKRTREQLATLKTISDGAVLDGVCVVGTTVVFGDDVFADDWRSQPRIPLTGFRIADLLVGEENLSFFRHTCGSCQANACNSPGRELAGCHDYFYLQPYTTELEAALREAANELRIAEELSKYFVTTSPTWYGFWINSPLRGRQVELLSSLLPRACEIGDLPESRLAHFLRALDSASACNLPLHVDLAAPSHSDMGWTTVFPHCPRCMADAGLKRWQSSYPTEPQECAVCGHVFVPNETQQCEEYEQSRSSFDSDLESLLTPSEYWELTKKFVVAQGFTEDKAEATWLRYRKRQAKK